MGNTPTSQILQGLVGTSAEPAVQVPMRPTEPVQVPMRPSDQPADTTAAPPAPVAAGVEQTPYEKEGGTLPMHPVDAMATMFMKHVTDEAKENSPGSFGAKLAGALDAAGAGLGDARTGGDPGQGHGWLSAVGATLGARTQRLEHLKEIAFDQKERLKNDQINLATANANLRQHAMTIQQQEKTIRDASASSGSKFMDTLRANYKVSDNISQDELMSRAQADPKFLQTHTARITGYEPVMGSDGKPKMVDGVPVEMPKFSIADIAPGDMSKQYTVDATHAKKWADSGLKPLEAGTVMPVSVANQMDVQAERYGTTLGLLNLSKVQPLPDSVKDQMVSALQDPEVQHAVSMQPGSPLAGLYEASENVGQHLQVAQQQLAAAQKSGNADVVTKAQQNLADVQQTQKNLDQTINSGFTPQERSAYQKQMETDRKQTEVEKQNAARDAETARHNRAEEAIKTLEASGGSPEALQDMGQKLADAEMVPSQLSKRSKNYNASWLSADKQSWSTYGKPYDGAQAESEYKYASNSTNQNVLKLVNGVTDKGGSLDIALDAAKALPGMDSQTLNKVFNTTKTEFGNKALSDFQTAMLGLSDEYAKIMGGGNATVAGQQQALDILKAAYAKNQMAGAATIVRKDIAARQRGIIGKNRFLQKQYYGNNGMTVTMISPDGKNYQEVPKSQAQFYTGKGARIANKQDYANLNITSTDH